MQKLVVTACAKINWSLDITGRREDGYHLMDMLMQPVTLADTVTLTCADTLTLVTGGEPYLPPDESHLAWRAAMALRAATGTEKGALIEVVKRIPVGAGMGGGSADAAAVLIGLNRLWNLRLSMPELEHIGLTLGADVPYFIRGGLTRTQGIGEKLEKLPCARTYPLCVIQPCEGLSTGAVFKAYHACKDVARPQTDDAQRALETGDSALLAQSLANVMQPVSEQMRPEITEAIAALRMQGAFTALMTGSGSAVFGVFEESADAARACNALKERWVRCWACETVIGDAIACEEG